MRFQTLLLLMLGLSVSACTSTPATNFYILAPMATPAETPLKPGTPRLIGLGPVTLPALLERKQLVTRSGGNTVHIAELHQWAEPLKDNFTQTLAKNLATLRTSDLVKAYPWSAYGDVDYRILIDVARFDTTPGQSVDLEAHWAIMAEKNHNLLTSGQAKISRPLADTSYAGAVNALSAALAELSQQLAAALDGVK